MKKVILFALSFLCVNLYADQVYTVDQYCVWMASFGGNVSNLMASISGIGMTSKTDFYLTNTRVDLSVNPTTYALLSITPVDKTQQTNLDNMETAGSIRMIRQITIKTIYDGRLGSVVTPPPDVVDFNPLPNEFYKVWKSS